MAAVTQSEDTELYFRSQGWDAVTVDGHDPAVLAVAIEKAKADDNGRPKVIIARTIIGKGIPEVAGTAKGHGEGGAKFAAAARAGLGLPAELFYVSPEVSAFFAARRETLKQQFEAWQRTYESWTAANPELAAELTNALAKSVPTDLLDRIPAFPADYKDATRAAGGVVINAVAKAMPDLLTGSADLFGSTKNYLTGAGDFSAATPAGRNLWFGIREHAMGAICNGLAYDGLFRPSCATFLVFADYMRGSIRLAALAGLPVTYIFTHDSVGVGEDGPTHQPVETVSGLRVIPNLDVIRPADAEETAGAWESAMQRGDGPTALILTRQTVPLMNDLTTSARREGAARGGYIARRETGPLTTILLSCGSELQHALAAAAELGDGVRVVSMPCFERFDRQSPDYRESVLPAACTRRVAIEAGVGGLWWKYAGSNGRVLGIDRFGISAPANLVMAELGMTKDHVIAAVKALES
jgi:transketolase